MVFPHWFILEFEASKRIDKQNLTTVQDILLRYLYVSVGTESHPFMTH